MKPSYLNWTGLFVQYPRSYVACTGTKFSLNVAKTAETLGIPSWFALPGHADRALAGTIKHAVGGIGTALMAPIDRQFGYKFGKAYKNGLDYHKGNHLKASQYAVERELDGYSNLHNDTTRGAGLLLNLDNAHKKWETDLEKDPLHPSFHKRLEHNHNAAKSGGHGHYVGGGSPRSEVSSSPSNTKSSKTITDYSTKVQKAAAKAAEQRWEKSFHWGR